MDGGDATRITDTKQGVVEFSWSPDGEQIAYIAQDPPINGKAIKEHNDVFEVTDGNFQLRTALAPWHLWVVPEYGRRGQASDARRLQPANRPGRATPLVWSHDGKHIVFTEFPSPYSGARCSVQSSWKWM